MVSFNRHPLFIIFHRVTSSLILISHIYVDPNKDLFLDWFIATKSNVLLCYYMLVHIDGTFFNCANWPLKVVVTRIRNDS